ncbi:hypothetical protein KSC_089120 [Ktedonobacter sp. SOSP1-52]|nr:hypothetical protein KSC_089120 [Ktedonobacter sp. SOSP1-52]
MIWKQRSVRRDTQAYGLSGILAFFPQGAVYQKVEQQGKQILEFTLYSRIKLRVSSHAGPSCVGMGIGSDPTLLTHASTYHGTTFSVP